MATLKSLVDETTNIKNELKTCHNNLSSALISKGVEVSNEDKMSNLIDKVGSIECFKLYAGDTYTLTSLTGPVGTNSNGVNKYQLLNSFLLYNGGEVNISCQIQISTDNNSPTGYFKIEVCDEQGQVVKKIENTRKSITYSTWKTQCLVKPFYTIKFYAYTNDSVCMARFKDMYIKFGGFI